MFAEIFSQYVNGITSRSEPKSRPNKARSDFIEDMGGRMNFIEAEPETASAKTAGVL